MIWFKLDEDPLQRRIYFLTFIDSLNMVFSQYRESSSDDSDDSDSSEDSHYRRRRRKNKKHQEKDPIRLCATLTAKFLMTAFKSEMIWFKLDEDPLQHRFYFLTFIDSLNMVFSQYRETYEVLRDYPKLEGGNIKEYEKIAIINLLHANRCVHSRRLIAEFPVQ